MAESKLRNQGAALPPEDDPGASNATPLEAGNVGLPGRGTKSHLDEVNAIIPMAKEPSAEEEETSQDEQRDSMTAAVMENLRVGVGVATDDEEE